MAGLPSQISNISHGLSGASRADRPSRTAPDLAQVIELVVTVPGGEPVYRLPQLAQAALCAANRDEPVTFFVEASGVDQSSRDLGDAAFASALTVPVGGSAPPGRISCRPFALPAALATVSGLALRTAALTKSCGI